jgi:hypothetical protein
VTHICAGVAASYPQFGPNLIRALTLQSTLDLQLAASTVGTPKAADLLAELNLVGYGMPRLAHAIESTDHRVVLFAEDSILPNGVHIYEVPIPQSFRDSGGERGITVALSFDPETRSHRLDYMATKMDFHLIRGIPADQLEEIFLRSDEEAVEAEEDALEPDEPTSVETGSAESDVTVNAKSQSPSGLGRALIRFAPSATVRSRGANQLGRRTFRRRFTDADAPLMLVVRNTNRWALQEDRQDYAVTVTLERDESNEPIYADLRAAVTLPIEIEIETS